MATLQKQYEKLHDNIKLGTYDENDNLREKRDLLIESLKNNLKKNDDNPQFVESFNQGSYALGTGIKPINGDYDIDVGVEMDCLIEDYDPVKLKKIVRDALTHNNREVNIRRSCVTVTYKTNGETDYHVDIAVYARDFGNTLHLSKGKENSNDDNKFWLASDPNGLISTIKSKFLNEDRLQFRRCVRYLKHWRNFRNVDITSIAITSAAYHWLKPDTSNENISDNQVLLQLIEVMLNNFVHIKFDDDGGYYYALQITLPNDTEVDLLEKLTPNQMKSLQSKLAVLKEKLEMADCEPDIYEASKKLQSCFSEEFPLPAIEETAKKVEAPYIQSGTSA